jgi:ribosomal protein L37AE/L43A
MPPLIAPWSLAGRPPSRPRRVDKLSGAADERPAIHVVPARASRSTQETGSSITEHPAGGEPVRPEPAAFAAFRGHPVPCLKCRKRQLRPRVRTGDFRCSACAALFSAEAIAEAVRLSAEKAASFAFKADNENHEDEDENDEDEDENDEDEDADEKLGVLGFLVSAVVAVGTGYAAFVWQRGWWLWGGTPDPSLWSIPKGALAGLAAFAAWMGAAFVWRAVARRPTRHR